MACLGITSISARRDDRFQQGRGPGVRIEILDFSHHIFSFTASGWDFFGILGVRSLCLSFYSVNFLICFSALCIIVLWRSPWAHGQAPAPSKAFVGVFLEKTIALDLAWLYLFLEIRPWRFHSISAFVHDHCGYLICSELISIRPWKLYPSSTPPKGTRIWSDLPHSTISHFRSRDLFS